MEFLVDENILGHTDKITQRQLSGLHFKQDEQEDKAAFEIQTQVKKKKIPEFAVF